MDRFIICSPIDVPSSKSLNGQSLVTSYVIEHRLFGKKVNVIKISCLSIHKLISLYYISCNNIIIIANITVIIIFIVIGSPK